jgi:NAD(P)H-dependent FMN reductase
MLDTDLRPRRRFLFLVASARTGGNSEWLARRAAARLPASAETRWLRLAEFPLPPFHDERHVAEGISPYPAGTAGMLLEETLAATDLVFVVPLYWYSLPASAKLYLDHWSGWLRVPGAAFAAHMASKRMWAIGALSNENRAMADPLLQSLRLSAAYLQMTWAGSLLGHGNRPGDMAADTRAIAEADRLFAQTCRDRIAHRVPSAAGSASPAPTSAHLYDQNTVSGEQMR